MSIMLQIFNFIEAKYVEEQINFDKCGLEYSEDLVIKLASNLKITPVCISLFSLYSPNHKVWLCHNQLLKSLQTEFDSNELKFELRIRYVPFSLKKLSEQDSNAFEYYFFQIRHDFLNYPKKKFNFEELESIFGIAIQDVLRIIFEKSIPIDDKQIEIFAKSIYDYCPEKMQKPLILFNINQKVKQTLKESYHSVRFSKLRVKFVKKCYIEQYLKSIAKNHYDEEYNVDFYSLKSELSQKKLISYQVNSQYICIRNIKNDHRWEQLFTIYELMFISVLKECNIRITHTKGSPVNVSFENNLQMKSFISLLLGYYRLCERWNLNICSEYYSPWLDRLKKLRCHFPIDRDFALKKLKESHSKNNAKCPFLFQQSWTDFSKFFIVFEKEDNLAWYTVSSNILAPEPVFYLEHVNMRFDSYVSLFDYLRTNHNLFNPMIPRENDDTSKLLLCRIHSKENKTENKDELIIFSNDKVRKSKLSISSNDNFCVRIGNITTANVKEFKVLVKEFYNQKSINLLKDIDNWIHLNEISLINCKGIILNPLSVLFEYFQTTLRDLYSLNKSQLTSVNFLEASYFLAKALEYLYCKNLTHGFISFDNLYVSHFSENKLCIKLGDPIALKHSSQEKPWLPPEYFDPDSFNFQKITFYSDVWAFGTTVWQIYSNGDAPNFSYETIENLDISHLDIPKNVSNLMNKCWTQDYNLRIQPSKIFKHLLSFLSDFYEKQKSTYCTVNNTSVENKSPKQSLVHGSYSRSHNYYNNNPTSLSNVSINSGQTDTTSLNPMEDAISLCTSEIHPTRKSYEIEYINENQLELLEIIGQGNYGKVYKAMLQTNFDKKFTVAVKIIIESPNHVANLNQEIEIMTKLKHKNIVQIIGFSEINCSRQSNGDYVEFNYGHGKGIVMEFVELGSLNKYLEEKYQNNETDLPFIKFALDIAEGLDFLANQRIIHRDLAARNILVKSINEVKISDFGLAHILKEDFYKNNSERSLPLKWHAPESIEYHKFETKSDIWSFGILLWEMYTFCQNEPYAEVEYNDLSKHLQKGKRLPLPSNCPAKMFELMLKCWEYQASFRPDTKEILTEIKQFYNSQM